MNGRNPLLYACSLYIISFLKGALDLESEDYIFNNRGTSDKSLTFWASYIISKKSVTHLPYFLLQD